MNAAARYALGRALRSVLGMTVALVLFNLVVGGADRLAARWPFILTLVAVAGAAFWFIEYRSARRGPQE